MSQPMDLKNEPFDYDAIFARAGKRIAAYLKNSSETNASVIRHHEPQDLQGRMDFSLPVRGKSMDDVFQTIEGYLENTVQTVNPQFLNQLFSTISVPALLGEIFSSVSNTSMYTYEAAPVATLMETELIRRMSSLLGLDGAEGMFVTGGSNANMIAVLCARNSRFPALRTTGYDGQQGLRMYVSDQAHYSFETAANLLGIGIDNVRAVRSDADGRMLPAELEGMINEDKTAGLTPFFVAATTGTTVLGAFDPVTEIALITRKHGLWLHVDGSFGGSVALSPRYRHLLAGIEQADSVTWTPHKMMNIPLICSAIIVKEKETLRKSCAARSTEYLFHDEASDYDLGISSLQCGRRVDALKLWLHWQYYGDEGLAARIDRIFELAAYAKQSVEDGDRLELLETVNSATVCFRYRPEFIDAQDSESANRFTLELRECLARSGKSLVNHSTQNGRVVIRLAITNPDMGEADLDRFFTNVKETGEALAHEFRVRV